MKKIVLFLSSASLACGLAYAQEETEKADSNPGARIAAYGKVGRVIVDGQSVYISKGLTDVIMAEGEADLENDDRIRCQQVKRTGTHISIRVCRTVAEIEEQSEFNQEYFERWYMRQRRHQCSTGGTTRGARIFETQGISC